MARVPTEHRYDSACVYADDQLFIIGGKTILQDKYVSLVQSVHVDTGESRILKPLKSPRSGMSAVYFNDEIYIFGGKDMLGALRTVEK